MRRVLVAVFLCAASPALALSCLQPDPVRDFKQADASAERWGAVVGRLDFDESRLPDTGDQLQDKPPQTDLRAQLVGQSLGAGGWKTPFQGNITLRVQCFGPWCGRPKSGARYLVFLKHEDGKRVAFADPCGARMYRDPSRRVLDALHRCFAGGPCEEGRLLEP